MTQNNRHVMHTTRLAPFALAGLIASSSLFTACGEDETAEADAAATAKKDEAALPEEPKDDSKAADIAYSYNAVNRRDPFKTYFDELSQTQPEDAANLTELQKIDLDKLKLRAVVVGTATPMAMVEDPSGRGHTVKIGTLIGRRLGQVKHIRRGEIVVQEEFRDFTGKRIPQLKDLKLEEGTR